MNFSAVDNFGKEYELQFVGDDIVIPREKISAKVEYVDMLCEDFNAKTGDEGYYVVSDIEHRGSHLCNFTQKDDCEYIQKQDLMPIFGVKKQDFCLLGVVKELQQNFYIVAGVKDGNYYLKLRFYMTAFGAYEDI